LRGSRTTLFPSQQDLAGATPDQGKISAAQFAQEELWVKSADSFIAGRPVAALRLISWALAKLYGALPTDRRGSFPAWPNNPT